MTWFGTQQHSEVRIVETWKWDAHHLTLRFDSGETLIVGGLLIVDPRALTRIVADKLDVTLTLPKRVGNGEALAAHLLSLRRRTASQEHSGKGTYKSETNYWGSGIAGLSHIRRVLFSE